HALVVVGGERLAVEVEAVADHADLDALAIAQQRADLRLHFLGVPLADDDHVADAALVGLPDQEGGAALADAGDEQFVAAADLLHVGHLGLADGDARDVGDLADLLLAHRPTDGPALGPRPPPG